MFYLLKNDQSFLSELGNFSIFWDEEKTFLTRKKKIFFFFKKSRKKVSHLMTTEQSGGKEGWKFLLRGFLPAKLGDDWCQGLSWILEPRYKFRSLSGRPSNSRGKRRGLPSREQTGRKMARISFWERKRGGEKRWVKNQITDLGKESGLKKYELSYELKHG